MLVRIISAIVALPLLFFFVIKGGIYLELAAAVISGIAIYEFFNAVKDKYKPMVIHSYIFLIGFYFFSHQGYQVALMGLVVLYITSMMITFVIDHDKKIGDVGITIIGAIYIIFFLYHVVLFSKMEDSYFIWYIFIVSWGADTGAYFAGKKFGKRKLSPTVSPNKTVEGAIGGMFTAALMSVGLSLYFDDSFIIYGVCIAVVGSIISIFGDLVASKIKREMDIKDFGHIMPGHGGIMDRFDSLLLVTPFVYYCVVFIQWIK